MRNNIFNCNRQFGSTMKKLIVRNNEKRVPLINESETLATETKSQKKSVILTPDE